MLQPGQHPHVVWTYSDYRAMPDDGKRYEIIDGDLFVTPAPTTTHQQVSKRIGFALMLQLEQPGHGVVYYAPVDVIFGDTRTVQPDLLVVRQERRNIITPRGIEGPPDLIVEILSPSSAVTDRTAKQKLYSSERVLEYWIADPEAHTIEVFSLGAEGYVLRGRYGAGQRVESGVFALDLPIDPIFAP